MEIKVTNVKGFRIAQACTAKEKYQRVFQGRVFQGVNIEPNGTVVGTDGFRAGYCYGAVEAFEGEPVTVRLEKALPATAESVVIDTGAGTCTYTYRQGKSAKIVTVEVIEGSFPDWRRVLHGDDVTVVSNQAWFDPMRTADVLKVLTDGNNASSNGTYRQAGSGQLVYWRPWPFDDERGCEFILVCLRQEREDERLVLPLMESITRESVHEATR